MYNQDGLQILKGGRGMMQVVYSQEEVRKRVPSQSIFLAGPSPRNQDHYNWRPEAIQFLDDLGFEGTVFVPLPQNGQWGHHYDDQIEWELKHLDMASVIVFWIPRDLETLPAFTTNVEFGLYVRSGKIILGFPGNAPKMKYLVHLAQKYNTPILHTLEETLQESLMMLD